MRPLQVECAEMVPEPDGPGKRILSSCEEALLGYTKSCFMTSLHFLGKVSLRGILRKGDSLLISRDAGDTDRWEIPGGRLHEDESLEDGLRREVREELGVDVTIGPLIYSEQFHQTRDGSLHLLLTYELTLADPQASFVLDSVETAETRWITKEDVISYVFYDNCLRALCAYWHLSLPLSTA